MTIRQRMVQLDQVQKGRLFKIIASVVILIVVALVAGSVLLNQHAPNPGLTQQLSQMPETVTNLAGDQVENPRLAQLRQVHSLMQGASLTTIIAVGSVVAGLLLILVVWLGLGLVYPVMVGVAVGLYYLSRAAGFELTGSIIVGMFGLALTFMVLMRGLSLAMGFAHPVLAIARNVLAEAIRMKISLVFIVMLFFVLAALPMLLNDDQSLRYRVQSFLQYSAGFTFMFLAMLVVFFGAATVTYEQREKVIWQTMTKPVASWQYLLGKWLGVVSLAAVLLAVSAMGVFGFTEYLRWQPAKGELTAFQPADGSDMTEDRMILETQVLASRASVLPGLPFSINDASFDQGVEQQIANERQMNPGYNPDAAERRVMRQQLYQREFTEYFSIDPETERYEEFVFQGLGWAKAHELPLTLRYLINAEGNRPDMQYILTFAFDEGTVLPPRRTGLGFSHTLTLSPRFINNKGELRLQIYNGQIVPTPDGNFELQTNLNTFTIPPGGLEISYSVGGYRANFVRVFFVLWVKLAMLAMLAVWASTFASFPVACLIAGGLFFMGQSAGFVQSALPGWGTTNVEGNPSVYRSIVYHFADWVSSLFTVYNQLRPTARLAEGQLLSWGSVSRGVMALGTFCAVFYLLAVLIFRRRQLAIYSGN